MDKEAPLPYIRKDEVKNHKAEEVKFKFEVEETATKTSETVDADKKTVVTTERITSTKVKTKTLKCYGHTAEEDPESFFIAFERLQTEMEIEWRVTESNQGNDAQVLFDAVEKMLIETASTEWKDILAQESLRNWKAFKSTMGKYITEKVLPDDAYEAQITYLNERAKPRKLTSRQWYLRMQTISRYLPYFIPNIEKVKLIKASATFPDWWKEGGLSEFTMRQIVKTKAPESWVRQLKLNTVGSTAMAKYSAADIIGYYETLETFERQARTPTRSGPNGRMPGRGRQQGRGQRYAGRHLQYQPRQAFGGQQQQYGRGPYHQQQQQRLPCESV